VNITRKLMIVLALVLTPVLANAQGKIAVLDVQEAILNTDVAKKRLDAFRAQPDIAENVKQLETFQALVEQIKKDSAVMSAEQKQAQSKKIQEKRADIEHVGRKLKASEQEMAQALMQELGPKLQQVVGQLIQTEGIGLLLSKQAVMHVDSSYSISAKVTDKLNQLQ
jgi:outer membrane protein